MKRYLLATALLALALPGCDGSGSKHNPTAEISDCLTAAGAQMAQPSDLPFAETWAVTSEGHHSGQSGTLSVGFYRGRNSGGWAIYYVARKGYRVSVATLRRQPNKAAKVVAYIHPRDSAAFAAASACLEKSKP